ncbi:alpha/beta hydrolase [Fictibacillus sp. NRS-1165]|uniref:alpha/beta hydrolase n=1 Tax=Fictibacillus sp. NRS-1165 TaxID=3144463 RepID=UPI003D252772
MKMVPAKSFTFRGGSRAVLLLHGFTGNTVDVRELGRFLNKKGYSCHGPLYEGHGETPETLVTTRASQWWENVVDGYRFLQKQGHEEIAVVGLSLGGVFALQMAYTFPVKGLVSMCAPVKPKSEEDLRKHVSLFTRRYKTILRTPAEQIEEEWLSLQPSSSEMVRTVQGVIEEAGNHIQEITCPALLASG